MKYLKLINGVDIQTKFELFKELDPLFRATKELVLLLMSDLEEEWERKQKVKGWDYYYTDCKKVSISKVQKLIDMGADVNAHDDEKWIRRIILLMLVI